MGGREDKQHPLFSYVSLEQRIPAKHPLRQIRELIDESFKQMVGYLAELYSHTGLPSICLEYLLRASWLPIFYTIRSEPLLIEQLDYNLLFRWFVGLSVDDPVWDNSVFSKNRERLLNTELASFFVATIRDQAWQKDLISDEHFFVDGTLLKAWASMKSFRSKDVDQGKDDHGQGRNPEIDFQGKTRSNDTHASTTDPDAQLYKKAKGRQAQLCYMGHVLMENRNGVLVDTRVTPANGTAEHESAIDMLEHIPGNRRIILGSGKGYDYADIVGRCRDLHTRSMSQKSRKIRALTVEPFALKATKSA